MEASLTSIFFSREASGATNRRCGERTMQRPFYAEITDFTQDFEPAGSDAPGSIRSCSLSSAQKSEGILAFSEL